MISESAENQLQQAIDTLARGGVVLCPTDTVWGLLCDFELTAAVEKIFRLKKSEPRQMAVLSASLPEAESLEIEMPPFAKLLAEKFWPGALTLVLKSKSARIKLIAGENNTIGIRIPDCAKLRNLITKYGKPIAATSANLSGMRPAHNMGQIPQLILSGVDYLLNFKLKPGGLASTVVDCTKPQLKVIREGAISAREIYAIVGNNGPA
jgi:L-threonylcarbamoyladenylate synthase